MNWHQLPCWPLNTSLSLDIIFVHPSHFQCFCWGHDSAVCKAVSMSGHMATFSTASEHVPRFVDSQIQPKQNLLQLKKTMFFNNPYHPCMAYLRTFGWFFYVNVGHIYQFPWMVWGSGKLRKRLCWDCFGDLLVGVRWDFVVYIRLMDKIRLTSLYGKYPIIYRVSAPSQVVGRISEPSTVCLLQTG